MLRCNGTTVETTPRANARSTITTSRRTTLAAGATLAEFGRTDAAGEGNIRFIHNADGPISLSEFASAAWRDRMKFDIEAGSIVLQPDAATPCTMSRYNTTAGLKSDKGFHLTELGADPTAPATNNAIIYAKDNGSNKTQVCIRFPTGAVQMIATNP